MANLDDATAKAKEFLNDNKVKDALKSDKVEEVSDSILGAVAGAADKITGGKFHDKIEEARDAADKKIGND
ncbi:antitoxin protein [Frondihabitans sp. PAMC 28766]|uniref:Rv0909 family putative TA system antitoxin n=1 Tax=Frondihabitans sp. PAMC 28766 TaxID=1795630 RepID=UPI00078DAC9A|nr:Rv0909 family putative TA system antitoxin [Frondihabitans sp. PAMC 28766]AMM19785.1 antitoxin protein [Frondihabitans sp. PAMC 28766]